MHNDNDELVNISEAVRAPTTFNNVVEGFNSVSNVIDDKIVNKDKRSLNEPTKVGKNGIRGCKTKPIVRF